MTRTEWNPETAAPLLTGQNDAQFEHVLVPGVEHPVAVIKLGDISAAGLAHRETGTVIRGGCTWATALEPMPEQKLVLIRCAGCGGAVAALRVEDDGFGKLMGKTPKMAS